MRYHRECRHLAGSNRQRPNTSSNARAERIIHFSDLGIESRRCRTQHNDLAILGQRLRGSGKVLKGLQVHERAARTSPSIPMKGEQA